MILFDESLNDCLQKSQMDLIVRFWDSENNQVRSQYLGSEFPDSATAESVLEHLKQGISDLLSCRLLQLEMDGL